MSASKVSHHSKNAASVVYELMNQRNCSTSSAVCCIKSSKLCSFKAEIEILANVKELLVKKGIKVVNAVYLKTAKNAPVADLYEKMGFGIFSSSEEKKVYKATIDTLPNSTGVFKEVVCGL